MNGCLSPFIPVHYTGSGTTAREWLIADERGSIISITSATGAAIATNSYDEYGLPGASNSGRYGYTGQVWLAETGLYHYKNRVYHPGLGRFMQTDPIGQAGGMNIYAYVGGDPVNATDSMGLMEDPDITRPDVTDQCPFSMYCGDIEFAYWLQSYEASIFFRCSLTAACGGGGTSDEGLLIDSSRLANEHSSCGEDTRSNGRFVGGLIGAGAGAAGAGAACAATGIGTTVALACGGAGGYAGAAVGESVGEAVACSTGPRNARVGNSLLISQYCHTIAMGGSDYVADRNQGLYDRCVYANGNTGH